MCLCACVCVCVCVCVIVCLLDLLMTQFVTVSVCSVVYYDRLCNSRFVARVNEHVEQEIQIARHAFHRLHITACCFLYSGSDTCKCW